MATQPEPVAALISAIPTLPRPFLVQLTERLIDVLDEIDGDADLEDDDPDSSVDDDPMGIDPEEDLGADDVGEFVEGGDVCDDQRPIADPAAYREHRARLQRERCFQLPRPRLSPSGYQVRVLLVEPAAPSRRQLMRRKRGVPRQPRA